MGKPQSPQPDIEIQAPNVDQLQPTAPITAPGPSTRGRGRGRGGGRGRGRGGSRGRGGGSSSASRATGRTSRKGRKKSHLSDPVLARAPAAKTNKRKTKTQEPESECEDVELSDSGGMVIADRLPFNYHSSRTYLSHISHLNTSKLSSSHLSKKLDIPNLSISYVSLTCL